MVVSLLCLLVHSGCEKERPRGFGFRTSPRPNPVPVQQRPKPPDFKEDVRYKLGESAYLADITRVDTIFLLLAKMPEDTSEYVYVPFRRSFTLESFVLDTSAAETIHVIIEHIDKSDSIARGDTRWWHSDGDYFFVRHGIVSHAFLQKPDLGLDSSMQDIFEVDVYAIPSGVGRNLLITVTDAAPSYGPSERYSAYGICQDGTFREFPGLNSVKHRDFPNRLTNGQIFTASLSYGCIGYSIPIRYEEETCRFNENPHRDSIFVAEGQAFLSNRGTDSLTIRIFSSPDASARQRAITILQRYVVTVSKYCVRTGEDWFFITTDGGHAGWIDKNDFSRLGLDDCG